MGKVIEYSLIESDNHEEFVAAVNEAIANHWQPQGGIAVQQGWWTLHEQPDKIRTAQTVTHYAQAMVRYADL